MLTSFTSLGDCPALLSNPPFPPVLWVLWGLQREGGEVEILDALSLENNLDAFRSVVKNDVSSY